LFGDQKPDICFIIKDSIPKKADQDENIRQFTDKLKNVGIDYIKTIIPISQLKDDYKANNLKLKFCHTYDVFLVEAEILDHVNSLLGKVFVVKRKRPFPIDMRKQETFKISIDHAIRKVAFKLSAKSNLSSFEVGTMQMDNCKIADNIMSAVDQLKEKWPGAWKNIMRLYLKPMKPSKVNVPIYYSNVNPNDVEKPVIKGSKEKRVEKINKKLAKSKKFKVDEKTKQVVKKKNEKKLKTAINDIEKLKDKKRKLEPEIAQQAETTTTTTDDKEEEKIVSNEDASKKKKNKGKKDKAAAKVVVEEKVPEPSETVDEPAKKKKKLKKTVEPSTTDEPKVVAVEKSEKKAKKNKQKPKVTAAINDSDEKITKTKVAAKSATAAVVEKKNKKNANKKNKV
jgi:hypothetical protein